VQRITNFGQFLTVLPAIWCPILFSRADFRFGGKYSIV
jgi:hypothetical protein